MDTVGVKGTERSKYDQDTLYKIPKKLIKYLIFFKKIHMNVLPIQLSIKLTGETYPSLGISFQNVEVLNYVFDYLIDVSQLQALFL